MPDPSEFVGRPAVDAEGTHLGTVSRVFIDGTTAEPSWLAIDVELVEGAPRPTLVPFVDATFGAHGVELVHDRATIVGAPTDPDGLHAYYDGALRNLAGPPWPFP